MMAGFAAIVEQARDGWWSAWVVGEQKALGTGARNEEDLSDSLRDNSLIGQ
jgi:hypothetical protein